MHNQADKRVFLFGVGLGYQQCERGQAGVVDDGFAARVKQTPVAVQEIGKQKCAAAFVAV